MTGPAAGDVGVSGSSGVATNPFVFIVGCPRSGTTLLQRLLDAHGQLSVINETLWILREADAARERDNGMATPELVSRLFDYSRFERLDIPRERVEALLDSDKRLPYASFVAAVFDLYGAAKGKKFVGDKSPGYVREIAELHDLFPGARFVHLIRDGRDIWLSVEGWKKTESNVGRFTTWDEDPVSTTALWWERSVRLGREAARELPANLYQEVQYESLVAQPAETSSGLCASLGLPYDDAMLRFHEGRTRRLPGLPTKRQWLPPTAGIRDWRRDMPRSEIERFEAVAGDLLDELGYERAALNPGGERQSHAERIRELFTEDTRARGGSLPTRWAA